MAEQSPTILSMFDNLDSLDSSLKNSLRESVAGFQTELLFFNVRSYAINRFILTLFKIIWRIAIFIIIIFFINKFTSSYSVWEWIGILGLIFGAQYFLYSMTLIVTGFLQSLITLPTDPPQNVYQKFITSFLVTNTIASIFYLFIMSRLGIFSQENPIETYKFVLLSIFSYALVIYTLQIIFLFTTWLLSTILERNRNSKYPRAVIVALLINLLFVVEKYPKSWPNEDFKIFISYLLEKVSKLIQYKLPKKLSSGDKNTNSWIKTNLKQRAQAFRETKKLLLISNQEAYTKLSDNLAQTLHNAILGNWDNLEQLSVDSHELSKTARTFKLFSRLIFALIPIAIIIIIQNTSYALEGIFAQAIYFIGIIYLIISIASLDPEISEKIQVLREFTNLFKEINDKK